MNIKRLLKIFVPMIIGAIFAFLPPPIGLEPTAMIFMGSFLCVILWLLLDPIPDYLAILTGVLVCIVCKVVPFSTALSPFAESIVWLLIAALAVTNVLVSTGLMKRVVITIASILPENYTGQLISFYLVGVTIGAFTPSGVAKCSFMGTFTATLAEMFGVRKGSKPARGMFGAMYTAMGYLGNCFMTGSGLVLVGIGLLPEDIRSEIGWFTWLSGTWVYLLAMIIVTFLIFRIFFKPAPGDMNENLEKGFVKRALKELGPMSKAEKISLALLVFMIFGLVSESLTGLDATVVCMIVWFAMAFFGLFEKTDIPKIPWQLVLFTGGILCMAPMISATGIMDWLVVVLGPVLEPVVTNPVLYIVTLTIIVYIVRLVIIPQSAAAALFVSIVSGLAYSIGGMHPAVTLFIVLQAIMACPFKFSSVYWMAALGASGDRVVEHKDMISVNFVYMILNIAGCLLSIPLWKILGWM